MIKAHIPNEQYGFIEIEYKNIDELEANYSVDYLAVKRSQQKAELSVREAKEKATPKQKAPLTYIRHSALSVRKR